MRFADTSFWFGLHVAADGRHPAAVALWRRNPGRILTSNLVLGEVWTLLRFRRASHHRAIEVIDAILTSPTVEVVAIEPGIERHAWSWLRQHDERVYSFVDATSYMLMRRRRITEALAFDGDFSAAGFVEVRPDSASR